jgi:hypothetical protein
MQHIHKHQYFVGFLHFLGIPLISRGLSIAPQEETKMEALVKTNFFISRAERDGLQKLARKQGVSAAALLRRILDSFLGIQPEPIQPVTFKTRPPK